MVFEKRKTKCEVSLMHHSQKRDKKAVALPIKNCSLHVLTIKLKKTHTQRSLSSSPYNYRFDLL
jgi:hypothetical protein